MAVSVLKTIFCETSGKRRNEKDAVAAMIFAPLRKTPQIKRPAVF
jgi:hypothetical protein